MELLNDKVTGATLTADEWNQVPSELQNIITQTGQSLTNADLNQVGNGIAKYVANGTFYTDSGAINAFVLTGIGTKQSPTSYVDGFEIRFLPANTNTSACTVNVATLGVKNFVRQDLIDFSSGEIVANEIVRANYDLANDAFVITPELTVNNFSILKSGRRNTLINGDFDLWQRGVSSAITGFLADRWFIVGTVSGNTQTQQLFTLGQTDVPDEPEFYHRNVMSSGSTAPSFINLQQEIESVQTLAGEIATLSFYARSPTSLSLSTEILQDFGTGGSPSSNVQVNVKKYSLTPTFQRFTSTFTIPSISGKTIGSNDNDDLTLKIWLDAGSDFNANTDSLGNQSGTIELSHLQIEKGDTPTNFEKLFINEIISLCERFFQKSYDINSLPGIVTPIGRISETAIRNSAVQTPGFEYRNRMRTIPTITIYSDATGAAGFVSNAGDQAVTIGIASEANLDQMNVAGGNTNGLTFQWTADAEL